MNDRGSDRALVIFRDDGHLSDDALGAFGDGEEACLPAHASAHLDTCDACVDRLANVAVEGFALRDQLRALAEEERSAIAAAAPAIVPAPRFPWVFLVLALLAPTARLVSELAFARGPGPWAQLGHRIIACARALRLVTSFVSTELARVALAASILVPIACVLGGIWIARLVPRRATPGAVR